MVRIVLPIPFITISCGFLASLALNIAVPGCCPNLSSSPPAIEPTPVDERSMKAELAGHSAGAG
jgi:hypothetical protein